MNVLMISRPTLFSVPGGDTVQVRETAAALQNAGVEVAVKLADEAIDYQPYDLIHFFNVIRPNAISPHVKKSGLPYVISTVFVDYTEVERKHRGSIFRLAASLLGSDGTEYLKTIARSVKNKEPILDDSYLWRGHRRSVEQLLNGANMLLPNSESEFRRLQQRYRFRNVHRSISNAVSDDFFQESTTKERRDVLCIGRIELIKNQLNLIRAVNETDIQLRIVGTPAPNHQGYFEYCKSTAAENVKFLGQLSKAEVIQELSRAKVHVLPSYFETTGLSSLEAAAMGCNVVITDKGDTREYFGDLAFYCDPDSPESIRGAIQKALHAPVNPALKERLRMNYRWEITAKKTLEAYESVLRQGN